MDIKVPVLPESVADATVAHWHKKVGDSVLRDTPLVDIETDKVVLEVVAGCDGILQEILKPEGSRVLAQECIGQITEGAVAPTAAPAAPAAAESAEKKAVSAGPAARRMAEEKSISLEGLEGSGRGGRILTSDLQKTAAPAPVSAAPAAASVLSTSVGGRGERRVPMTRLRARIAERLLHAQQTAAILTTVNEINMAPVMALRAQYKTKFEEVHKTRLGFMSFFIKAVVAALKQFPSVNASISGSDIIYHDYCDIGVAVSSPRGLVVPVLRDVQNMSMAQMEAQLAAYGHKAKEGTLTMDDLNGGTFTISNGGVFGSLLSTPILNPPQVGILGMHKIQDRPIVENGQMVIRPMMYVALSYDHRLIDGSESVRFLVMVKELVEDPARLLLDI